MHQKESNFSPLCSPICLCLGTCPSNLMSCGGSSLESFILGFSRTLSMSSQICGSVRQGVSCPRKSIGCSPLRFAAQDGRSNSGRHRLSAFLHPCVPPRTNAPSQPETYGISANHRAYAVPAQTVRTNAAQNQRLWMVRYSRVRELIAVKLQLVTSRMLRRVTEVRRRASELEV